MQRSNHQIMQMSCQMIIKFSIKKIKFLLSFIDRYNLSYTIAQLYFFNNKISNKLRFMLLSLLFCYTSIINSNISLLFIKLIRIEKYRTLNRSIIRARGRIDKIKTRYNKIILVVEQKNIRYGTKS